MWAITTAIGTQHAPTYPRPSGVEFDGHWPKLDPDQILPQAGFPREVGLLRILFKMLFSGLRISLREDHFKS
ncbi:hypothetical protein PGT21_019469 [Puccinia graminis f. sp. tritici]|uniref:Uncharacterized protein n=1 Tax=Puccinia graminis f. sp. tritici TaxID=56615 RepID=A0A5B0PF95_PUCGR|nr:hypothetical protein PGTUg99_030303 [Puccinia graminis f. sp. tritici]KAA1099753.1 hypothetical protein PGT21_019469 [Puccinia graminis f. sp. tritici]